MINWKCILVFSAFTTALFAQTKVEGLVGKPILKDKDNQTFEIKEDTKLSISIVPSTAIDKLVLQNLFQVKIASDKQEVVFDAIQTHDTVAAGAKTFSATGIYYKASKELTKQDLHAICFSNIDVKEKDLKYETSTVECVKTGGCIGYTLGVDKKFKKGDLGASGVCVGKKEASISTTIPTYEEKIICKFYDESPTAKNGAMITYTHNLDSLKEKHVKSTTGACN